MRLVVTGGYGMLGKAIVEAGKRLGEVWPFGRGDCDIIQEEQTRQVLVQSRPDVVVHTAAYTDVDGCELYPEKAFLVNASGTRNVVLGSRDAGATMVYISTDYVFDGKKGCLYGEEDQPSPLNVYGRSKLAGEAHVRGLLERHLIVRTEWLYGRGGRNFVESILKMANERDEIQVVNDQVGSPTYTHDLARGILRLIKDEQKGTFHLSNQGLCSWFDFAQKILSQKEIKGIRIIPIASEELKRPARRPAFSGFDCSRYQKATGEFLRPWEAALIDYLRSIE